MSPEPRALTTAGRQDLEIANLQNESQTLRNLLGDLEGYSLSAKVTNLVPEPIDTQHRSVYHCILSRTDSFTCSVGADQISLPSQRNFLSAPDGAIDRVAAFVASRLHLKAGSSEAKEPVEPDAPEGADAEAAHLDPPS